MRAETDFAMTDANKKVPRNFQCREALWQKFEQMARELECSVDYLINDAMKQYARQRGYTAATTTVSPSIPPPMAGAVPPPPPPPPGVDKQIALPPPMLEKAAPPPPAPPAPGRSGAAPPPPAPPAKRAAPPAPPAPPGLGAAAVAPPPPAPPPPAGASAPQPLPPRKPPMAPARSIPPPGPPGAPRGAPPPPPPPSPAAAAPAAPSPGGSPAGGRLSIQYQGQGFPVTKDRFIIGRGKQSSDLTIKDPNVSRQHAMIEFLNGQYYIVDMGSTNGVEYNGQRVQRKVINEGDIFKVCDHELRFSYQ
jgi:neural Wiskott-Aldrich syndrome protein